MFTSVVYSKPSRQKSFRLATAVLPLILGVIFVNPLRSQEESSKQTFAQQLVERIAAKHRPEVTYLGVHTVSPKAKKSIIFAATDRSKIGKESSCGDLDVMEKGVPILEMKGKSTTILERLRDQSGNAIGLIAVGFKFGDGGEAQAAKLAKQIGEELAQEIPSKDKLFETAH